MELGIVCLLSMSLQELKCTFSSCTSKFLFTEGFCKHVNRHVPQSDAERANQFCCPICGNSNKISFEGVGTLKKHMNKVHPQFKNQPSTSIQNQPTKEGVSSNKRKKPSAVEPHILTSHETSNIGFQSEIIPTADIDYLQESHHHDITNKSNSSSSFDVRDEVLRLYSTLFARTNTANKTVEEIIRLFTTFIIQSLDFIGKSVQNSPQSAAAFQSFQKCSFDVKNTLLSFNTKQKLVTGLKGKDVYEEPKQFLVKSQAVEKLGVFKEEQFFGTIMPIEYHIRKFLEMPNVFVEIMKTQNKETIDGFYENLVDGELWKEIKAKFEGRRVVPIYLYYDDFQPDSGVGAHGSSGKLGAYYYSFPTLPDYLATNLKNIFIAALVNVDHIDQDKIVEQEFDPCLHAIFKVLSKLEEEGLKIVLEGKTEIVHIVLPQALGDNAGLNACLGFPRGFTALFVCRICIMHKADREQSTHEVKELLRNKENFEQCLNGKTRDERKGVKFNCILNFLDNYKVYLNYSVDVMHDVYLGVFKDALVLIINFYTSTNTFTLPAFNEKKKHFDYGKKDKGNLTDPITEMHLSKALHMNAKEVWTLIEYLPLILMTLVPDYQQCPVFSFAVKMGKVLDCIMQSAYTEDEIVEMEQQISSHHDMFLNLFPTAHLTPKFHNMLHYGTCVRLAGPLTKTMVFRFEQKHQELKAYAKACYSRVNLPLSICQKFCLEVSRCFLERRNMFVLIKEIVFARHTNLLGLYSDDVSNPIQSVKFKSVKYEIGDIIYYQNQYYRIEEMVKDGIEEEIYIYSKKLIVQFAEHLGFYKIINDLNEHEIIDITDLKFAPVNDHCMSSMDDNNSDRYFKIKSF